MKRDAKIGLFIVLAGCIIAAWLVGRALSRPGVVIETTDPLMAPDAFDFVDSEEQTDPSWIASWPENPDEIFPPMSSTPSVRNDQTLPPPMVQPGLVIGLESVISPPAAAESGNYVYTVQGGDNFWTISHKVYGRGKYFEVLKRANQDLVAGGA